MPCTAPHRTVTLPHRDFSKAHRTTVKSRDFLKDRTRRTPHPRLKKKRTPVRFQHRTLP